MTADELRRLRLINHQITQTLHTMPEDVVRYFCAMQAQEYAMAQWAVGLRLHGATKSDVEQAFQSGRILRTHVLRPTWHFVAPEDIRRLLLLTAPHVHKKNAPYYRKFELDTATLTTACTVLEAALAAGCCTRPELMERLAQRGIVASGLRASYIMMYAELHGLIASGPRQGKQFTYALLDHLAPPLGTFCREESLAWLAQQYFLSRGPACARDFAYWSGLSVREAQLGAQSLGDAFEQTTVDGQVHYFHPAVPDYSARNAAFLLPDYDEYAMSYRERNFLAPEFPPTAQPSTYSHWLIVHGRIAGTWARDKAEIHITPFAPLNPDAQADVDDAVSECQRFYGMME